MLFQVLHLHMQVRPQPLLSLLQGQQATAMPFLMAHRLAMLGRPQVRSNTVNYFLVLTDFVIAGDEANAIQTAPSVAKVDSMFPLVRPATYDNKPFDVMQHVGNLSPFQSVDSSAFGLPGASAAIPKGCSLNQVHLLHRHGARYPTADAGTSKFAANIHAAASNGTGFTATGPLSFLNTWTYKLGAEILTPFGRGQLFNLGVGFRVKYGEYSLNKFRSGCSYCAM